MGIDVLKADSDHGVMSAGAATQPWQIRCHDGPFAREAFILCRPGILEEDIAGQTASAYGALSKALRHEGGSEAHVVQETAFFGNIERDLESFQTARRQAMRSQAGRALYAPSATFIQQAPVAKGQLIELLAYAVIPKSGVGEICPMRALPLQQTGRIILLDGRKHVSISNICGDPGSSEEEAYRMFHAAGRLLQQEQMSFRDVVRTWIHLRDIDRDYAGLNLGRRRFFRDQNIEIPPASTGIQGAPSSRTQNMCLSLYAVENAARNAHYMSTPTLNEAWTYGSDFSRGIRFAGKNGNTLFVSGTASVDEKGFTVHNGDFEAQAERMLLNIATLLAQQTASWSNVVSAITYLKDPADAPCLAGVLANKGINQFPNAIVHAPVCRPDLLCEMEAIAVL
jgi:enamine deaminase RidA (YjgF/YER057c/UK114 family)